MISVSGVLFTSVYVVLNCDGQLKIMLAYICLGCWYLGVMIELVTEVRVFGWPNDAIILLDEYRVIFIICMFMLVFCMFDLSIW